ncbi:hypothetical protein DH2020_037836 [Rehmannia glutinosa]|uniref:Uncharacterized protein n=1 Tax=Rehmannia glutinosa TaxID=99300 RepID=A0ABR0V0A3_REHGL
MVNVVSGAAKEAKKLGEEDPRRIVHSLKVGLAITVVSLLYYFDFLYEGFGVSAMWAVITVVVVFEFSVGATLGRGVNRGIATLLGGALGVGAHRLASFTGGEIQCVILGVSVFLIATVVTFIRFFPKLKARYDYGLLIFILTFCLITVSGSRDDEVIEMAHRRLSTVLVGGSATLFISLFIFPNWAGEDLHKLTASNIEKLGIFLEGFGHVYFHVQNYENQASLDEYKTVLNFKAIEDSLVNFAKWEPSHDTVRNSKQDPRIMHKMSTECGYALREVAMVIKTMTCSLSADHHIVNAKTTTEKLISMLKTGLWADTDLVDIIPAITDASLLIEIVSCIVKITDSVHELATLPKFKSSTDAHLTKQTSLEKVTRIPSIEGSHSFNIVVE